ncbi:MAG: 50S ribosomal protein L3 [Chthoniobacter sp.]|nr:50S ribosomal protein L3 [Chthoniobacter sp.]
MKIGLLGKKIGMTRVYDDKGNATPVTVIEAGGNAALQVKTEESDGYSAVQVGFDTQKSQRVTKPLLGHFQKASADPKKFIREFRLPAGVAIEGAVDLNVTQFAVGDVVDVIGRSKGKGFQGVMKKHNMAGQPMSHGHMMHRRNGAIGNRSTPGRIWKNMGMPGHLGDERITVQNLRVVQVRPEEGVILISGAVPGANGGYVIVRPAIKGQPESGK